MFEIFTPFPLKTDIHFKPLYFSDKGYKVFPKRKSMRSNMITASYQAIEYKLKWLAKIFAPQKSK